MSSKLVITLEGPAKLEPESFMQMVKDTIDLWVKGYEYYHAGKIDVSSHFMKQSGRVEE